MICLSDGVWHINSQAQNIKANPAHCYQESLCVSLQLDICESLNTKTVESIGKSRSYRRLEIKIKSNLDIPLLLGFQ